MRGEIGARPEAALVEDLGDEGAHVGVHAPGLLEEQALLGADGDPVAEDVSEGGDGRSRRVDALERLVELLGIAEQSDAVTGRRGGQHVRERHLAGLVDEQHVDRADHVGTGPQPVRSGGDVRLAAVEGAQDLVVVVREPDKRIVWRRPRRRSSGSRADCTPASLAASQASSSRPVMTRWLFAVMPTRLPALTRATIIRAPMGLAGARWSLHRRAPSRSSASARMTAVSSRVAPSLLGKGGSRRRRAIAAASGAAFMSPLASTCSPRRRRLAR